MKVENKDGSTDVTDEPWIPDVLKDNMDEIDKWLFKEFGIMKGCCSAQGELKYSIAREVAEKTMEILKSKEDGCPCPLCDSSTYHDDKDCLCSRFENWSEREKIRQAYNQCIEDTCIYLKEHIDPHLVIFYEETWSSLKEFTRNYKNAMLK